MDGSALKKGRRSCRSREGRRHAGPQREAGVPAGILQQQAVDRSRWWRDPTTTGSTRPARSAFSPATGSCRRKSDRTGFRLDGPQWTFTEKAYNKLPENGAEPSNIIDHGYPLGAINLAGQTPIILVNDGPSMGGFINPYTVPSAAFWKLGQSQVRATSIASRRCQRRRGAGAAAH